MVLMQNVALGFLWQDGETGVTERALEWSATIAPVYIVDLRAEGERFASLDDPPSMHFGHFKTNQVQSRRKQAPIKASRF